MNSKDCSIKGTCHGSVFEMMNGSYEPKHFGGNNLPKFLSPVPFDISHVEDSLMHLHHHEHYGHLTDKTLQYHKNRVSVATKDLKIDKDKSKESHKNLFKKIFGSKAVNTTLDAFQKYGNIKRARKKMTDYLDKLPDTMTVFEDLEDHRMAAFSQAAYEYYKGMKDNGNPAKGTERVKALFEEYSHYITDLEDYEVDEMLSTVDNLSST